MTSTIGYACGRCLVVRKAHYRPDFCGCGARFDRGAPLAMISVSIEADGMAIDIAPSVELFGDWPRDAADEITAAIAEMLDGDEDSARRADGRDT